MELQMLHINKSAAEPAPNTQRGLQKWPRRHETVTGWSIARAERKPYERAELAACWVLGSLTVVPTVTLAARVFGVSQPLVHEEVRYLKATTVAAPPLDHVWALMTEAERDAFVGAHITDIWTRIDRLTA
jgi:hypothetical protein